MKIIVYFTKINYLMNRNNKTPTNKYYIFILNLTIRPNNMLFMLRLKPFFKFAYNKVATKKYNLQFFNFILSLFKKPH